MSDEDYRIEKLNLLAFPRNFSPRCEITNEKASVQLITPHITLYYVNEELADQAYHGIIKKISHLIAPLLQPLPMVGTQEERNRRLVNINLSKRSLIEYCLSESSILLSNKKYSYAYPAAYQALKFIEDLDGKKSLNLIEPYLHLTQAVLGMKKLLKAEEYLSIAEWILLNHTSNTENSLANSPSSSSLPPEENNRILNDVENNKIKYKLYILKGKVNTAQENLTSAKYNFSLSIYYSSKYYGAESIISSLSYYYLGDVFLIQGNIEISLAFFDKVVDIWYKYLYELFNTSQQFHQKMLESNGDTDGIQYLLRNNNNLSSLTSEQLTEENLIEGKNQLEVIYEHRKKLLGNGHIATGEVLYTLGLYEFFLMSNEAMAEKYTLSSLQCYDLQLGPDHHSTKHIVTFLNLIQNTINEKYNNVNTANQGY